MNTDYEVLSDEALEYEQALATITAQRDALLAALEAAEAWLGLIASRSRGLHLRGGWGEQSTESAMYELRGTIEPALAQVRDAITDVKGRGGL